MSYPRTVAAWTDERDDETFCALLELTCAHVDDLSQLATDEHADRPGLAECLSAFTQTYAGQVLDLIERWPG